jgi:hypothetical protein
MRYLALSVLIVVASSVAVASEFTYLEGSVTMLSPRSGGTISYSTGKSIELKTALHKVAIPYVTITNAELGEVHTPAPDPVYKVWSLHKRFVPKGETQEITLTFKDDAGEHQTVTLELTKQDAAALMGMIEERNEWWGDRVWRTKRNTKQWAGN